MCTRRAGKSYGGGLYLFKECAENPGVTCLYIAKTLDSAKNIMWKDVFKDIADKFKIDVKFNDKKSKVIFPNGSEIILVGTDSSQDDMEKLRGQKLKLVIIDEGSTYRINVHNLVYKILKAALWDLNGTIAMIGTPTDFVESFFARATLGKIKGWSNHFWTAAENPHIQKQYQQEIDEAKEDNPDVEDEAWFQQEYRGLWVVSDTSRVFRYNDVYVEKAAANLNVNLGIKVDYITGKTGYTVLGYSSKSRQAFIVESLEISSVDLTKILDVIFKLQETYDFISITAVGMTKRLIEGVRLRFPISLPDDIEKDELAIIRLFQSELLQNNIKVLPKGADIVREWDSIVQDNTPKFQFHPTCATHRTIAALYAWLECYNYTYQPEEITDDPNDAEWEKEAERINNEARGIGAISDSDEEISGNFDPYWWR